jgi:hypothetical protein
MKATTNRLFGTNLLSMNMNTIKSLCKSNKFHYSSKNHFNNSFLLDSITNLILNNNQQMIRTDKLSEIVSAEEEFTELEEFKMLAKLLKNVEVCEVMNSLRIQTAKTISRQTIRN